MRIIHLFLLSALLAGCGGEAFQDLRDFVKNSGADMRGKIPPPPEVKPYEPFVYNNDANLPDPFKPRKQDMQSGRGGINQPDLERPKEALEEFPLENLKMVGYLFQKGIGYAVIRAPDGKLHRVKAGNYIGSSFGLISEVNDTEVIVKEKVQDSAGDWSDRVSSLQLLE
ncbi:MAG: pilus assembly protein PilP [Gallionellales bacterium RIFCSPLOWO2_12_FULL_59_22]|nr:MAG: pilus assembly protein PilP [Gallionellales bacterium RIFCSPLOWO2_02_FULL_59_110]OGT05448.1 MAG: pilus assembly protein PilP [Gallionellales bacterium RIFCSPLOWO2_02_58_13]OGT12070.1 MAG: pilus assembly protein PilP [Gallionellales bacterium RIFCSPLOWO2_12_FULL_59_22]